MLHNRLLRVIAAIKKSKDIYILPGLVRPVIDRQYALDEVPEAHRYVEQGHKRGNVVIRIVDEEKS
jgi:hypothetical protein